MEKCAFKCEISITLQTSLLVIGVKTIIQNLMDVCYYSIDIFVYMPYLCIEKQISKQRFEAILKGIDAFKANGDVNTLNEQELQDVLIAAGVKKDGLWGGKE